MGIWYGFGPYILSRGRGHVQSMQIHLYMCPEICIFHKHISYFPRIWAHRCIMFIEAKQLPWPNIKRYCGSGGGGAFLNAPELPRCPSQGPWVPVPMWWWARVSGTLSNGGRDCLRQWGALLNSFLAKGSTISPICCVIIGDILPETNIKHVRSITSDLWVRCFRFYISLFLSLSLSLSCSFSARLARLIISSRKPYSTTQDINWHLETW